MHTIPKPHFPLRVVISHDGIEWAHFYGSLEYLLSIQEFPDALARQLIPTLTWIAGLPEQMFILDHTPFHESPADAQAILQLTAWWVEWRRRIIWGQTSFRCTHCKASIELNRRPAVTSTDPFQQARPVGKNYRCLKPRCPTAQLHTLVGDEPTLYLVPSSGDHTS
jgi:hypothetical protein